jgi:nicotinate-nucleotide adenylyltransferase
MAGARHRAGSPLSQPVRKVGLLGGSFNPAHGGHRHISLWAARALGLDAVWWLVSPGNPLKAAKGMAPLPQRFASARAQARRAPIRVTAIEAQFGTRYTVDTLARLRRRYPHIQFIWLMGADNLAQFHQWRAWRRIAATMPIAVVARPGYDAHAMLAPAMAWLGRWRRRAGADWGAAPSLTLLRTSPDPRSASALRAASPDWAAGFAQAQGRDALTFRAIGKARDERLA